MCTGFACNSRYRLVCTRRWHLDAGSSRRGASPTSGDSPTTPAQPPHTQDRSHPKLPNRSPHQGSFHHYSGLYVYLCLNIALLYTHAHRWQAYLISISHTVTLAISWTRVIDNNWLDMTFLLKILLTLVQYFIITGIDWCYTQRLRYMLSSLLGNLIPSCPAFSLLPPLHAIWLFRSQKIKNDPQIVKVCLFIKVI